MTKIAVILSGSGVFDGSELHEAVLSLLAIEQQGGQYQCFAPNIAQHHVINHLTGEEEATSRNVLVEAARIARGEVKDLRDLDATEFDALVVPGGFGAAKNLSNFAFKGANAHVQTDVLPALKAFVGKPALYMCIAPALLPEVYGKGVSCTIGTDADTANQLEVMGANHSNKEVTEYQLDEQNQLVTTPAYMLAGSISEANQGIQNAMQALFALIK